MAEIIIYTTTYCPYCTRAKALLDKKRVKYTEINVIDDEEKRKEMIEKSGRTTVPQIFINGKHIGGYDDLYALEEKGELDALLKES